MASRSRLSSLYRVHLALFCFLAFPPTVWASGPEHSSFPEVGFRVFAGFIQENFDKKVSLATVLTVLFTVTNNPDLLNLHARQQHRVFMEEQSKQVSGWMKALSGALKEKLGDSAPSLFQKSERSSELSNDQRVIAIGMKLDELSKLLGLDPYDKDGKLTQKLTTISNKDIEPALVICPPVMECKTSTCNPRSLFQNTDNCNISEVTLIKDTKIYDKVLLLSGWCPKAKQNTMLIMKASCSLEDRTVGGDTI